MPDHECLEGIFHSTTALISVIYIPCQWFYTVLCNQSLVLVIHMQAGHVVQPEGLGMPRMLWRLAKAPTLLNEKRHKYIIHFVCVTNVVRNKIGDTIWLRLEGENHEATFKFIFKREIEKCPHLIFLFVCLLVQMLIVTSEPTSFVKRPTNERVS